MLVPILITSILVALDALFVGMSIKLQKGYKTYFSFVISAIIFAMCIASYFIAGAVREVIKFNTSYIIGGVFLLLALRNFFAKDEEKMILKLGAIIVLGLIMSVDGFAATAALTIEQGKTFLIPVFVTAFHLLFLLIGCFVARFMKKLPHKTHNKISACCLALVAILNFAGVF